MYEHLERRSEERVPKCESNCRLQATRRSQHFSEGPNRPKAGTMEEDKKRKKKKKCGGGVPFPHLSIWFLIERRVVAAITTTNEKLAAM
jgi:hypothetical protein